MILTNSSKLGLTFTVYLIGYLGNDSALLSLLVVRKENGNFESHALEKAIECVDVAIALTEGLGISTYSFSFILFRS